MRKILKYIKTLWISDNKYFSLHRILVTVGAACLIGLSRGWGTLPSGTSGPAQSCGPAPGLRQVTGSSLDTSWSKHPVVLLRVSLKENVPGKLQNLREMLCVKLQFPQEHNKLEVMLRVSRCLETEDMGAVRGLLEDRACRSLPLPPHTTRPCDLPGSRTCGQRVSCSLSLQWALLSALFSGVAVFCL